MATPTPSERLAAIDAEINRILTSGQRVKTPHGMEVQRVDLEKLYAERRRLEGEVTPEQSGQSINFIDVGLGRVL